MFIELNGSRIYFDVDGAGLVPDGNTMREKPTLILLHGGPGFDHTLFKPAFSALTDIAQVVYLDHRGNGRSGGADPATWNLSQWGCDVKDFCDALGIQRPIVYGVSFGGFVAQSYATQFPEHPSRIVLVSTAARMEFDRVFEAFERLGGTEARQIAEEYWSDPSPERRARYIATCLPLYRVRRDVDQGNLQRAIIRNDVAIRFNGRDNEHGRMDFRSALGRVRCPVLIMAGEDDPITPPSFSEVILSSLPDGLGRLARFRDCGHGVLPDQPEQAFHLLREFILAP